MDVIICVHNALGYVKRCLASVVKTLGPAHRLIVIDDASDPPTAEHLARFSRREGRLYVHRNAKRMGYTQAANQGLRLSTSDFVILLNSDTRVAPNWIEKLCDALYSSRDAGIVGPLSNAASFQSIPDYHSTAEQTAVNQLPSNLSVVELDLCCEAWTYGQMLPRVPLVHGFCLGIRRALIEEIGFFDEQYFPDGYGEEDDFCLRASDAGFALYVATHTYVFHAKTKSYSLSERQVLTQAAARALRERHGGERFDAALLELASNPMLARFRREAAKLYVG